MFEICRSFFDFLNQNNIRYCHWKSNSHLEEALVGKTDLDILVDKSDEQKFQQAINAFNFKRVLAPPEKRYPGLEDYLGFDEKTGGFIHLHVHYKLVMGQRFIKNHHLPFENIVLDNLVKKHNVFIPCPELELIFLILRAHMKISVLELLKQIVSDLINRDFTPFPGGIDREFDDLIRSSNQDKMLELLSRLNLPLEDKLFTGFIDIYSKRKLKFVNSLTNSIRIFGALKKYRRQEGISIYFRYVKRLFRNHPLVSRYLKGKKMTLPVGGKVFALVGADGSGKSTLLKDLEEWLSWRLTVVNYYHGIPKTVFKYFIPFTIRQLKKVRLDYFAVVLEGLYMVYLARRRFRISQSSSEDVLFGNVVVTDRFPLRDFFGMEEPMDGPQLTRYGQGPGRYFSETESTYYERISYPDRIFVLQASIDNLRERKDDLPYDYHLKKADAVNSVTENRGIVLIDANEPYPDVLLSLKKKIWMQL